MREKLERETLYQRNPRPQTRRRRLNDHHRKSEDPVDDDAARLFETEDEDCRSMSLIIKSMEMLPKDFKKRLIKDEKKRAKSKINNPRAGLANLRRVVLYGARFGACFRVLTRKKKITKEKDERKVRCKSEIKNLNEIYAKTNHKLSDGRLFWCRRSKWKRRRVRWRGFSASSLPRAVWLENFDSPVPSRVAEFLLFSATISFYLWGGCSLIRQRDLMKGR